jgi:undecaprenyl-diphosphatase
MDFQIYKAVNAAGPAFVHEVFRLLANDLAAVIAVLVALLFLLPWRTRRVARRRAAVAATAAAGLALLIAQPIANLIDRPRPFVAHPGASHLLIDRSLDPSFPSDHATFAFAIAVAVWKYDRMLGAVFGALAILLSAARVYVGTHYPGDVLGGAALGAMVALALRWPPVRRLLESAADWCSRLWDRLIGILFRRSVPSSPA